MYFFLPSAYATVIKKKGVYMSNECIWCGKTDTLIFICRCYEGKKFKTINWSYLYYRYVYKYFWRIIDKKGNK